MFKGLQEPSIPKLFLWLLRNLEPREIEQLALDPLEAKGTAEPMVLTPTLVLFYGSVAILKNDQFGSLMH